MRERDKKNGSVVGFVPLQVGSMHKRAKDAESWHVNNMFYVSAKKSHKRLLDRVSHTTGLVSGRSPPIRAEV